MLKQGCATRKFVRRNRSRVGQRVLVVSGLLLSLTASRLVASQSNSSGAVATPHPASPAAPAKAETLPIDGLTLTEDQKAKIAQIRQHAELRREAVIRDEGLSQGQKDTALQLLQRIEASKIFKVLTPDQQKEVEKRITARRAAEQQEQHQSKKAVPASPTPAPPTAATP